MKKKKGTIVISINIVTRINSFVYTNNDRLLQNLKMEWYVFPERV